MGQKVAITLYRVSRWTGSRPASRMRRMSVLVADGLLGLGPGHVGDHLFLDRAVHVVGAERGKRHLGQLGADHHPVGLDVQEVVEHQPADRDVLESLTPVVLPDPPSSVFFG